jgi:hypothetical protein
MSAAPQASDVPPGAKLENCRRRDEQHDFRTEVVGEPAGHRAASAKSQRTSLPPVSTFHDIDGREQELAMFKPLSKKLPFQ